MDYTMIFNLYSNAMSDAKMTAIKIFLDAFKNHPVLAAFYTYLILKRPAKAAAEFIKRFA